MTRDRASAGLGRRALGLGGTALLGLWCSAATAGPLHFEVEGSAGLSGAPSWVQPDLTGGGTLDFGRVANRGPQPTNGERVDAEHGTSYYVATLRLMVVQGDDGSFGVRDVSGNPIAFEPVSLDPGVGPTVSVPGWSDPTVVSPSRTQRSSGRIATRRQSDRGGYYIPAAGSADSLAVHAVDLYVSLGAQAMSEASVWFGVGETTPWASGGGVQLSFLDTLVAQGVRIGEPFDCQLALRVPPTEWGLQQAAVRFSARPSI